MLIYSRHNGLDIMPDNRGIVNIAPGKVRSNII